MPLNVPLRSLLGVPYRSPLGALAKSTTMPPPPTTLESGCLLRLRPETRIFSGDTFVNQGIIFFGTGPDLGSQLYDFMTVTLSGTGLYDGDYQVGAEGGKTDAGAWSFRGGELDNVIYQGPGLSGAQWQGLASGLIRQGPVTTITRVTPGACDSGDSRYPFNAQGNIRLYIPSLRRPLQKADFPISIINPDGSVFLQIPDRACLADDYPQSYAIIDDELLIALNIADTFSPFTDANEEILHKIDYGIRQESNRPPTTTELYGLRVSVNNSAPPLLPWLFCGDYTAVAQGPLSTYAALAISTGFNSADSVLRFSNIAPYDGDRVVAHITSERVELDLLWSGDATDGNWINGNTSFISSVSAPDGPVLATIQNSSLPVYNGVHTFIGPGNWTALDLWFAGTATGEIVLPGNPGIEIAGTGPPALGGGTMTIRLTNTTNYDGVYAVNYTAVITDWSFAGGDLDSVACQGDEFSGNWENVADPSVAGLITAITCLNPDQVAPFTSAEPQRSGLISQVTSSTLRISVADSQALGGGTARLESDGAIYGNFWRLIRAATASYVDAQGDYTATDTGQIKIRAPGM